MELELICLQLTFNEVMKSLKFIHFDNKKKLWNIGRDHGLPSFLDTRRKCELDDFKTFEDLLAIFPQSYIDLLKNVYDSVDDIDLYIGGALESFTSVNTVLVGRTFGCIIGEQYRHTMGGDAYYYTHKTSPYPFTDAQLETISGFVMNNLVCSTSGLTSIQAAWPYVDSEANTKVPCSLFETMNLTAWKDIWKYKIQVCSFQTSKLFQNFFKTERLCIKKCFRYIFTTF